MVRVRIKKLRQLANDTNTCEVVRDRVILNELIPYVHKKQRQSILISDKYQIQDEYQL